MMLLLDMDKWRTTSAPTHLCMNGGLLKVPPNEMDEFFSRYVETVLVSQLFIVEKITPRFRFFLDLDWISDQKPNLADVRQKLTRAIGSEPLMAISPPKSKGSLTKYGIHAHWPDIVSTKKEALALRERLPPEILEFADQSVYNTGLRMLWSHKKDGSLPYYPMGESTSPDIRILKKFSIRVEGSTAPVHVTESGSLLLDFVRRYLKGQSETNFKKRTSTKDKIRIESDSRYCERIGREHKSNHVFFTVDLSKKVIYQQCFDEECKGFVGKKVLLTPKVIQELHH